MWPVISNNREVQADYEAMRARGESHNIAKICATRQTPGELTDRQFNMGRTNNNQFSSCPELGNYFKGIAEKAGVSTTGKYYVHGLGRFPGDPRAWCRGRGDALAIARDRNLKLDGLVTHKGHEVDPGPDIPLAPDLMTKYAHEVRKEYPDMPMEEAKEVALQWRGPQPPPPMPTEADVEESLRQSLTAISEEV